MTVPHEFPDWIKSKGIQVNCDIRQGPHGNGLFASKTLRPGDEIARIPEDLIINQQLVEETAKNNEFLHRLVYRDSKGNYMDQTDHNKPVLLLQPLVKFLIYVMMSVKKGTPDEKFGTWIRSLPPARQINLPFSWTDDELELLEHTSIYDGLLAKRAHLKLTYSDFFSSQELRKELEAYVAGGDGEEKDPEAASDGLLSGSPLSKEVTFYDWLLIEQWILSRSLELNDVPSNPCLVPLLDMANHSCEANARYEYLPSEKCVVLTAAAGANEISEGTEITINYGPDKSAAEFLYCYGFIPQEFQTARSLRTYYAIMDPQYRKVLDDQYTGEEDTAKSELDISYELLAAFLDRPQNVFSATDDPVAKWHDDFIFLLACEDKLKLVMDEEAGYYELQLEGEQVDLNDVAGYVETHVQDESIRKNISDQGNAIASRMLRHLLEDMGSNTQPLSSTSNVIRQEGDATDASESSAKLLALERALLQKVLEDIQ